MKLKNVATAYLLVKVIVCVSAKTEAASIEAEARKDLVKYMAVEE